MMPMDPRQMKRVMKQMGMSVQDVPAKRVIIEQEGKRLVIEEPNITLTTMQGQKIFQVIGDAKEESSSSEDPKKKEEDVQLVMDTAKVSREEALKALEKSNWDIAQAIVELEKK